MGLSVRLSWSVVENSKLVAFIMLNRGIVRLPAIITIRLVSAGRAFDCGDAITCKCSLAARIALHQHDGKVIALLSRDQNRRVR